MDTKLDYLEKFILGLYYQVFNKPYKPVKALKKENHKNIQALCFIINKYFYTSLFPTYFWEDHKLYSPELEILLNSMDTKLYSIIDYYNNYKDEEFYELYPFYLESKFDDIFGIIKDYIRYDGDLEILSTLIFLNSVQESNDYYDAHIILSNNLSNYDDMSMSMMSYNCMLELDDLNLEYILEMKPESFCVS